MKKQDNQLFVNEKLHNMETGELEKIDGGKIEPVTTGGMGPARVVKDFFLWLFLGETY